MGGNEQNLINALNGAIQADGGSTNWVDAFKTAHASNPGAQARIFLTDGGITSTTSTRPTTTRAVVARCT